MPQFYVWFCTCRGLKRARERPPTPPPPAKRIAHDRAIRNIAQCASTEARTQDSCSNQACGLDIITTLRMNKRNCRLSLCAEKRLLSFTTLNEKEKINVHEFIDNALTETRSIILPKSSSELFRSYKEDRCRNAWLWGALADGIKSAKKGSVEGKTLRGLLCYEFLSKDVRILMGNTAEVEGLGKDVNEVCDKHQVAGSADIDRNRVVAGFESDDGDVNRRVDGIREVAPDAEGFIDTGEGRQISNEEREGFAGQAKTTVRRYRVIVCASKSDGSTREKTLAPVNDNDIERDGAVGDAISVVQGDMQ